MLSVAGPFHTVDLDERAFKSSNGIVATLAPAFRSLTPGASPFVKSTPADSSLALFIPSFGGVDSLVLPAASGLTRRISRNLKR